MADRAHDGNRVRHEGAGHGSPDAIRRPDPSLKLIACGSSGPMMPTYLEWDREVLEQCYENVDGLSLHRYFGNTEKRPAATARSIWP